MKKNIKNKWIILSSILTGSKENNFVLKGEDFYISYNPNTGKDPLGKSMDNVLNLLGGVLDMKKEVERRLLLLRIVNSIF